jgi:Protein of unknown function, DUF481
MTEAETLRSAPGARKDSSCRREISRPRNGAMQRPLLSLLAALLLAAPAVADQVELTDGSVIKGRITGVEAGKIRIETTFVGAVTVELAHVKTFATDEPVHVSLADTPAVLSPVAATAQGVSLPAAAGRAASPVQVTALWREGAESPLQKLERERLEKMKRKWAYEATVALTGRTGTSDKLDATVGGKATLASDHDRLILLATAERGEDNSVETANRQLVGADYSSFNSSNHGWYGRTSLETDKVKALNLRSATALGFTRKVVHSSTENLELRFGGTYTYEVYYTDNPDFRSPGLDFSLLNSYTRGGAKLNTVLGYLPSFRDTTYYRIRHESNLEVPLSASLWKLKVGIANEYQNVPPAGVERFDTTYFTSLLLSWK